MAHQHRTSFDERILLDTEEAPGGILMYYADGDEEIIHVNRYIIDLFECENADDFLELTGGTFRGFVFHDDVSSTEDSIWGQVEQRNGYDHIFYQIRTKSGRLVAIDDYGRLLQRGEDRPIFHVFIIEMDQGAAVDWLTGLPGVMRFRELVSSLARVMRKRGDRPCSIVFDLVGMKGYNRRHGRLQGDELLRTFGTMLRAHFGSDSCSRIEDRFFALTDERRAQTAIDDVMSDFEQANLPAILPVRVGAYACDDSDDVIDLGFERARIACNLDRPTWKPHVTWFTRRMRMEARLTAHVIDNLRPALEDGWIRPHYQPIVRTSTGAVCGMEALARWHDPWRGQLMPDQFIPVLEEVGLVHELDMHIVDCVLRDLADRRESGLALVPVSVNISLHDLGAGVLADELTKRADAVGIPHELLRVEFTESIAPFDAQLLSEQMAALHREGFAVWMDDFGSGHSSLTSLQEFDFDLVKLDVSFMRNSQFGTDRSILLDIVRSTKRLGMRTLAEGVETHEQALYLEAIGCNMVQGYHYGRPKGADAEDPAGERPREPLEEAAYWDAVCALDLNPHIGNRGNQGASNWLVDELPAGVIERRGGRWLGLRANATLRKLFIRAGLSSVDDSPLEAIVLAHDPSPAFMSAISRCDKSGTWELANSRLGHETGYLLYVSPVASTAHARAYAITSTPSTLGSALGPYGDVPVAYAVFHVTLDEARSKVLDTEYLYANALYRDWAGYGDMDPTGRSFLETAGNASTLWFPYCYRAVVEGEFCKDVVYSPETDRWLSFSVAPCPVRDCCVFSFSDANDQHRDWERLEAGRETSDLIIQITNSLNTDLGYDEAMRGLLEIMSSVIHPERLYIFERWEHTSSNTFEWCAPGITPEIDSLQNMDNSEFAEWDRMLETDSVVIIPDVSAYKGVDDQLFETLDRQGIDRLLAVPFYGNGQLIGYLGADNYALDERLDTRRLLETVASFIAARMTNRRLMDELARIGSFDPLTNLLNRRGIDAAITERTRADKRPFVLALLDIDDFKAVNDRYGHDVGDETLRSLSRILREIFPDDAIIGRNGGDEILIALFGDDAEHAQELFTTYSALDLNCTLDGNTYPYSTSIGYTWCKGPQDLRGAYTRADTALYEVKLTGKSSFAEYTLDMEKTRRARLGMT